MTIPTLPFGTRRNRYEVTNPVGQSVFTFTFPVDVDVENNLVGIEVFVDDVLVASADYTVNTAASSVTLDTPAAENSIVVLQGATVAQRLVDYPLRGSLSSSRLNEEMDRFIYLIQELSRDRSRSFVLAPSAGDDVSATLPTPEPDKVLVGNSTGTGFENKTPLDLDLALVSAYMLTLMSSTSAVAFRSAIGAQAAGSYQPAGSYAASGANSDITSLLGLTTPLSIPQDFCLTLTSGTPVTTSDVTAATTIYCTPYKGNLISLYNGTKWITRSSAEFSRALGTLTASRPYDVFCYDNAGVPTLEFLVWTNDTTRATALTYQDGILVKSGATTRLYLGTFYTTSTTTTEDSQTNRLLWNYYNRTQKPMYRTDNTASWTYTTAAWRQANANASNRLSFIQGVIEDNVVFFARSLAGNATNQAHALTGIGIDSATAVYGGSLVADHITDSNQQRDLTGAASFIGKVASAGFHQAYWLEYSQAVGTTAWSATAFDGSPAGGIYGSVFV